MPRLPALAAKYFAVLLLILMLLLVMSAVYHLWLAGTFGTQVVAVHEVFAPGGWQVLAAVLVTYALCLIAAWLRLRALIRVR